MANHVYFGTIAQEDNADAYALKLSRDRHRDIPGRLLRLARIPILALHVERSAICSCFEGVDVELRTEAQLDIDVLPGDCVDFPRRAGHFGGDAAMTVWRDLPVVDLDARDCERAPRLNL